MEEIRVKARRYALEHYGNLIQPDEPVYDSANQMWTVPLKASLPRIITDDANELRTVNVLTLDRICQLTLTDSGSILQPPTRAQCLSGLDDSLNLWNKRIERIVTRASSTELSQVGAIHHYLHPLKVIMDWIYFFDDLPEEEMEDFSRPDNKWDWINLLKSLQIIEYGNGRFGYGPIGQGLRERSHGKEEFLNKIISEVLSERYSYLEEKMKITQLSTLIHANSTYYRACVEADKIVKRHPKSIHNDYIRVYGKKSFPELFSNLIELTEGNVLHYDNRYFSANEDIFDRISSMNIEPSITPPF